MARQKINKTTEYVVTRIGYAVGGDVGKAQEMAERAGVLRSHIWNKYGSLKAWGRKADELYKDFAQTNPHEQYGLDYKQWQQTFNRVIDDIHAAQEAAKTSVIRKIYQYFKPEKDAKGNDIPASSFRFNLIEALKTLDWMQYPLLHRWLRDAYHRGHTWVNNQICVGLGNGATVKRVSRNVVEITINGKKINNRHYEKLKLLFKVGRQTPKGNMQLIFGETGCRLHFPKLVKRLPVQGVDSIGLDKGYTEAFTGSDKTVYGDGIGKVMTAATNNRHVRGKARNKLWQIAQKPDKQHIHKCNLGKKRHLRLETKKRETLRRLIRTGVNRIFNKYAEAITEDLSFVVKGKKQAKAKNRKLSEWCKKELQTALEQISYRRQSSVTVVNAAYTSQVDSRHGVLLGKRDGNQFFTFDGEVLQADYNAAQTIKTRKEDRAISRFTKSKDVRRILIARTVSFLAQRGYTLQNAINQGWFDPRHLNGVTAGKAEGMSRLSVA